jgi:very-short-patch-repair endonuclease
MRTLFSFISPNLMDKKEYIIRQLGRTKNKKYEAYVVSRIIHLLNDFNIKFVTQQYVTRPEGRALTDLFFPQMCLHIEVDEPYHKDIIENDKVREADIINATNHKILRVDVSKSIEDINFQIDVIVDEITNKIKQLTDENSFVPWNIDLEFNTETYIKRGYIDTSDNVAFKTIKDACNCFGHNYSGWMKGGAPHPDSDTWLWFPKLFPNGEWRNSISFDEEIITERNEDDEKAKEHIDGYIKQTNGMQHKRIVFANVKGNLGDKLYRFRGLYELSIKDSGFPIGLIWQRKLTRVNTYPQQ